MFLKHDLLKVGLSVLETLKEERDKSKSGSVESIQSISVDMVVREINPGDYILLEYNNKISKYSCRGRNITNLRLGQSIPCVLEITKTTTGKCYHKVIKAQL